MTSSSLFAPLALLQKILNEGLPFWLELLEKIEASSGRLHLRPVLAVMLEDDYPLLYEYPNATIPLSALIDPKLLFPQIEQVPNLTELLEKFQQHIQAELDSFDPALERMASSGGKRQDQNDETACVMLSFGVAQFFEHLSVGVHGERLSALVAQAKAGDDQAFGKAIQIDGRIAEVIPYFRERLARAPVSGDAQFLGMVGDKTSKPPYKGKIEHKPIWITLAFLDSFGWLARLKAREVLDFCQSVGVGEDIVDDRNMQRIITRFRERQKRGDLSTP